MLLNTKTPYAGTSRETFPLRSARLALDWASRLEVGRGALPSWIFLIGLVIISAATALTGAAPTRVGGNDDFFLLDNAWRTVCGQRPHLDYVSGYGALPFLILGLGLKLARFSANGLGYGAAIAGFVIGLWCYLLSKHRLNEIFRIGCSLYLALLVLAPCPPGYWPFLTGHAMWYNRLGYGIAGLVALECLALRRDGRVLAGGFSTGAAIGLAMSLKPSYFFVCLGFVGLSMLYQRSLRRSAGVVAGFVLFTLPVMAYLRFDVSRMMSDYRMVAAARSAELTIRSPLWAAEKHYIYLLMAIVLGAAASLIGDQSAAWFGGIRLMLAGVVMFFADIMLLITNAQTEALPLLGVFGLIVANESLNHYKKVGRAGGTAAALYVTPIVLFAALLFVPQFTADATSVGYGLLEKLHPGTIAVRFEEERLKGLLLYDGGEANVLANGTAFTTAVNDGVALLRRFSTPDDKVLAIDGQNPFPYALGWQPPRGGVAGANFNLTINAAHHPSDEAFFGDASVVMVPKRPAMPGFVLPVIRLYEPGLLRLYKLTAESDWWRLYRRS